MDALLCTVAVALLFAGALFCAARPVRHLSAVIAVLSMVASATLLAWLWLSQADVWQRVDWIEPVGVGFGWRLDRLAVLLAVIVVAGGLVLLAYSRPYWRQVGPDSGLSQHEGTFHAGLLLLTGSVLGVVFSENLFQLFVFWETADIAAFILIALHHKNRIAQRAAVKALLFKTLAGLPMLVGFLLLSSVAGTSSIPELLANGVLVITPVTQAIIVLILIGAAAKSAQVPLHVWLPDTMVAPTPVNAYLDAASVAPAGLYLVLRLGPLFEASLLWPWMLIALGGLSMLVGGALALREQNLKWLLAYSTISQFGFMFLLAGLGAGGVLAALWFLTQHAILKAGLFMSVGSTERLGTADSRGAVNLRPAGWAALAITGVLALSLGGLPPLAGFWMKELFFDSALGLLPALIIGVVGAALTLAYMLRFMVLLVPQITARWYGEGSFRRMTAITALPALLTLVFGIFPDGINRLLISPAAAAAAREFAEAPLAYHLQPALLLSLLALATGAAVFALRRYWQPILAQTMHSPFSLDAIYGKAAAGTMWAGRMALSVQNGSLQRYLQIVLLSILGMFAVTIPAILQYPPIQIWEAGPYLAEYSIILWIRVLLLLMIGFGTLFALFLRTHLRLILMIGLVGYLIGILFAIMAAPGLSVLQVHVETLITVLLVLILIRVPRWVRQRFDNENPVRRLSTAQLALAGLVGIGTAVISLQAIQHQPESPVAPWYNQHSQELTGAGDAVAAILIYFRALDTLGEVAVFATAAIGVLILVRLTRKERT